MAGGHGPGHHSDGAECCRERVQAGRGPGTGSDKYELEGYDGGEFLLIESAVLVVCLLLGGGSRFLRGLGRVVDMMQA